MAYQINTLAYNFLQMMDQQAHQLAEMESQVNYIAEVWSLISTYLFDLLGWLTVASGLIII